MPRPEIFQQSADSAAVAMQAHYQRIQDRLVYWKARADDQSLKEVERRQALQEVERYEAQLSDPRTRRSMRVAPLQKPPTADPHPLMDLVLSLKAQVDQLKAQLMEKIGGEKHASGTGAVPKPPAPASATVKT